MNPDFLFNYLKLCIATPNFQHFLNNIDIYQLRLTCKKLFELLEFFKVGWPKFPTLSQYAQLGYYNLLQYYNVSFALTSKDDGFRALDTYQSTFHIKEFWDFTYKAFDKSNEANQKLLILSQLRVGSKVVSRQLFIQACDNGNIPLVKWLIEENHCQITSLILRIAAFNGDLDLMTWAIENYCPVDEKVTLDAISGNQQKVLEFLKEKQFLILTLEATNLAVEKGKFEILTWLIENHCPINWMNCQLLAYKNNHFEFAQSLMDKTGDLYPFDSSRNNAIECLFSMCRYGNIDALKQFVLDGYKPNQKCFEIALSYEHINIVEYLFTHKFGKLDEQLFRLVIHGPLSSFEWLVKNNCPFGNFHSQGKYYYLIEYLAEQNALDELQILGKHKIFVKNRRITYWACKNSNFELLKWALKNQYGKHKDCLELGMKDVRIAEFLLKQNYKNGKVTKNAFNKYTHLCVRHGYYETFKWLVDSFPVYTIPNNVIDIFFVGSHITDSRIFIYIVQKYPSLINREDDSHTINAVNQDNLRFLQWLINNGFKLHIDCWRKSIENGNIFMAKYLRKQPLFQNAKWERIERKEKITYSSSLDASDTSDVVIYTSDSS